MSTRFEAAIAAIDAANAQDPATIVVDGIERPKELAHAELVTAWVRRLDPGASEAQLLAARAHHLRRWAVPRSTYPVGRAGYLRWRSDLKARHAAEMAEILDRCGYDEATIERVGQIIRKERLRTDPAVQTHEDALCLVFLQTQLAGVSDELGEERTLAVLRKTLAKMSPRGRAAIAELDLAERERDLLRRAAEGEEFNPGTATADG